MGSSWVICLFSPSCSCEQSPLNVLSPSSLEPRRWPTTWSNRNTSNNVLCYDVTHINSFILLSLPFLHVQRGRSGTSSLEIHSFTLMVILIIVGIWMKKSIQEKNRLETFFQGKYIPRMIEHHPFFIAKKHSFIRKPTSLTLTVLVIQKVPRLNCGYLDLGEIRWSKKVEKWRIEGPTVDGPPFTNNTNQMSHLSDRRPFYRDSKENWAGRNSWNPAPAKWTKCCRWDDLAGGLSDFWGPERWGPLDG